MLDPDELAAQQEILATHRRNLRHLLLQAAQHGGEALVPTEIANGIYQAREQIKYLKTTMRAYGIYIKDQLNDEPSATPDLRTQATPSASSSNGAPHQVATWGNLLARTQEQFSRFMQVAQGTPSRPGIYIAEVYVDRAADSALDAFLESTAVASFVVGESGAGKTSLLCHWAAGLLGAGHAVLFYRCGHFSSLGIERLITQDIAAGSSDELLPALEQISGLAAQQQRQAILIFDAINEFRDGEQSGPEALLKHINELVERLPAQHVRVVLSCNTTLWNQLSRMGTTELFGSRYYRPEGDGMFIGLDLFTPQEFAIACDRYCSFFHLHTDANTFSASLRDRLRKPLLLRMLAETYQNKDVPTQLTGFELRIFQRYFDERVQRRRDLLFVNGLAAMILRQRRSTLPIADLVREKQLSDEILAESTDSSYYRLLDLGILTETSSDPLEGETVTFTYTQVAAYISARYVLQSVRRENEFLSVLKALVREARAFPLAWDIARLLLLIRKHRDTLASLAQSTNVELRELAIESLMEIYADVPETAIYLIKELLQLDSEEARRTGLKAAYYIGPGAHDIFLWAAAKGSPALRQATKYTLYLIWRTDPDFTFRLLNELVSQIGLSALPDLGNIVEFAIDLPVTIYINHCERQDLVEQISSLHYEMYKNKLHLHLLNTGIFGATFEKLVFQAVSAGLARPALEWALFTEFAPADRFFTLPAEVRAEFKQLIGLLEPGSDATAVPGLLVRMLQSDIILFNVIAGLVLAVNAYRDFSVARPFAQKLFDECDGYGRLWVLISFAVLLPDTPPDWAELIETFTDRVIREHPEIFFNQRVSFLERFDILLLPLGLAYGKRGGKMPYVDQLLRSSIVQGDLRVTAHVLAMLGAIGFYYPQAVFQILLPIIDQLQHDELQKALVRTLSTMRIIHFNAVDIFLQQIGADDTLRRLVSAEADLELVRRYIYGVGLYNYHVHTVLFHPIMRRKIVIEGLLDLADMKAPEDFLGPFTRRALRAAKDADWWFANWTQRE